MEYTKEMIAELKQNSTLTYDGAKQFADKFGLSLQSVIGKARALDLDYVRKGETKSTGKQRSKADWVKGIEALSGVKFKRLDALLVEDLERLFDVIDANSATVEG